MTNKTKKGKLQSITVKNVPYKWRLDKEAVGQTLKIWKNKVIIVDEWFVSVRVGDMEAFVDEMIKFEKL